MTTVPITLGLMTSLLNTTISRTSLHKKFNSRTVLFFKKILQLIMVRKLVEGNILKTKILDNFSEILIIDSTSWDLPKKFRWIFSGSGGKASKANCKLQFCYDYKSGRISLFDELSGTVPDQRYSRNISKLIKKNSLTIFDLGYWVFDTFYEIIEKRGFFISRLNTQVTLYQLIGSNYIKIELDKILPKYKKINTEMNLYIRKDKRYFGVRIIAFRTPKEVGDTRRRRLKKSGKSKKFIPSKKSLILCDWSIFITNASTKDIPSDMIRTCYRIRWSIELIFKSFKSVLNIHKTNVKKNPNRLICELYAKLIMAVIVHAIHHHLHSYLWNFEKKEISLDKLWKYIDLIKDELYNALKKKSFTKAVNSHIVNMVRVCEKYHQKSRSTILQMIDQMIGDVMPVKICIKQHIELDIVS